MTSAVFEEAALASDGAAPPRTNGELVFSAPWEARAFALAVAVVERANLSWDDFRTRLVAAIGSHPERPYYENWATALEQMVLDLGLTTKEFLESAIPADRAPL